MKGKTRLKRILGVALIILMLGAAYFTYEVVRFNRDMAELGQGLGELSQGLGELSQGLAKLNFSGDSTATITDSLNVEASTVDTSATIVD